MSTGAVIDRRTMSTGRMTLFATHASGPLVVMIGGIPAAYAAAGSPGIPLGFLLVAGVLWLLSEGYSAVSKRVPHAAAYYAVMAKGLGRPAGLAAGVLALVAYGSIICCMYGLAGGFLTSMIGGYWWIHALLLWGVVAVLGTRPVVVSSVLLSVSLAIAVIVIGLLIFASIRHPAGGHLSVTGFTWHAILIGSLAPALVMCVASPLGFDAAQSFSTEAEHSEGPRRALRIAIAVMGVVYALLAWAIGIANGPDQVAALAADPSVGVPLNTLVSQYGFLMGPITELMLVFGIFATVLSVHAICARYSYAMAREGVMPTAVSYTGSDDSVGSPVGGSLLMSAGSLLVILGFALCGADPVTQMFSWLATIGAIGLVTLLVASSLAALRCLTPEDGTWSRWGAPLLGLPLGIVLLVLMVTHSATLLASAPGSVLPIVIPAVVLAVVLAGFVWAGFIAVHRPDVYKRIGGRMPDWLEVPDRQLTAMKL